MLPFYSFVRPLQGDCFWKQTLLLSKVADLYLCGSEKDTKGYGSRPGVLSSLFEMTAQ